MRTALFSVLMTALLCCWMAPQGYAQKKSDELKKKAKEVQDQINYTEKLLKQAQEEREASTNEVVILRKKIKKREQLISIFQQEVQLMEQQIEEQSSLVEAMEEDLVRLKEEYARMIYQAYKTRGRYDKLLFVFASDDFNQAYLRLKYLQQYTEYRKKQADLIRQTQQLINDKKADLITKKAEKKDKLNLENKERSTLSKEVGEERQQLAKLQTNEKKYKKELEKAQQRSRDLKKAIRKAIRDEIAAANPSPEKPGTIKLTPEALALSNNFASNKGKLPWPADNGEITGRFGTRPHEFLRGITVKNDGLIITTLKGTQARAVFDGVVSSIIIIPGAGKVVMIRHGAYISIYANLKETFVTKGDKVSTKDTIGTILTTKGKTEIEFQLWKDTTILDPSYWLYKAR